MADRELRRVDGEIREQRWEPIREDSRVGREQRLKKEGSGVL